MNDGPINTFFVHCGDCKYEWMATSPSALLHIVAESVEKMRCPQCGELPSNIFCGPATINTSTGCVNKTEKS